MGDSRSVFQNISSSLDDTIVFSEISAQSSAFGSETLKIRLSTTANCHIAFGVNPTATSSNLYLPANVVEYFTVCPGSKIDIVRVVADGDVYISVVS